MYVVAFLSIVAGAFGLANAVRLHDRSVAACPVPPAHDRFDGCAEADGIAQDSDGFFYAVRRCTDGTAVMVPIGRPPDKTPRARPEEESL